MVSKKLVLRFPPGLVNQPVVYKLIKDFDLKFNILKADITPREEGVLVLELRGKKKDYERGIKYVTDIGLGVQLLSQDIIRDEDKCTHCGACVTLCPSKALVLDPESRRIIFHNDKCLACEICVPACPAKAMEVRF